MVGGGGKRYVKNVCMYAALFRLSSGIVTQTARRRARRRRRRERDPSVLDGTPTKLMIRKDSLAQWQSYSNRIACKFVLYSNMPHFPDITLQI